jgi:uncharacterized damage-inducible protein DinB
MRYASAAITEADVPRARDPQYQHVLDTYASEVNKTIDVWRRFAAEELSYKPHERSTDVQGIFKHELLSQRRFFAEFLDVPEPLARDVLPDDHSIAAYSTRLRELTLARLRYFANCTPDWWLAEASFFDVRRQRIWVFWRRLLHSAHHRTQLTVYLRLLNKPVPAVYGPTADESWTGADPTTTVAAAERR